MNTLHGNLPKIKRRGWENYIIVNEDLEFAFHRRQIDRITDLHNSGYTLEEISKDVKRDVWEVLQALIHQYRNGVEVKPIAYRKSGEKLL